jgi:hypothetical protein
MMNHTVRTCSKAFSRKYRHKIIITPRHPSTASAEFWRWVGGETMVWKKRSDQTVLAHHWLEMPMRYRNEQTPCRQTGAISLDSVLMIPSFCVSLRTMGSIA